MWSMGRRVWDGGHGSTQRAVCGVVNGLIQINNDCCTCVLTSAGNPTRYVSFTMYVCPHTYTYVHTYLGGQPLPGVLDGGVDEEAQNVGAEGEDQHAHHRQPLGDVACCRGLGWDEVRPGLSCIPVPCSASHPMHTRSVPLYLPYLPTHPHPSTDHGPENQNMGTPVTEEKKRDTPITVPSPPTSRRRL